VPGSRTGLPTHSSFRRPPTHAGTHATHASPPSSNSRTQKGTGRTKLCCIRPQRVRDQAPLQLLLLLQLQWLPILLPSLLPTRTRYGWPAPSTPTTNSLDTYFPFFKIFFLAFSHRFFPLIDDSCFHRLRLSSASAGVGRARGDPRLLRRRPGLHRRRRRLREQAPLAARDSRLRRVLLRLGRRLPVRLPLRSIILPYLSGLVPRSPNRSVNQYPQTLLSKLCLSMEWTRITTCPQAARSKVYFACYVAQIFRDSALS
jgi:hypothetical protein